VSLFAHKCFRCGLKSRGVVFSYLMGSQLMRDGKSPYYCWDRAACERRRHGFVETPPLWGAP
jgi:hypothetical protein